MTDQEILIHFVRLRIQSHSYDLTPHLEQFFWSNDLRAISDHPEVTITVRVEREDSIHARAISIPSGAIFAETTLITDHCFYHEGAFYSANDDKYKLRLRFDLATNTLDATLGGVFLENDQWVIANLIKPLLHTFIMPFYGMRSLHGAALTKGDRTIFLYGEGGAGKSTTTLGLMRSGWDLLSDDGPFFAFFGGKACVLSSLDYVHVTDNTMALFPEFMPFVVGSRDNRDKFALLRKGLPHGEGPSRPQQVTHFLRLNRQAVAAPEAVPISRQDIAQQMLNEGTLVFRRLVNSDRRALFLDYTRFVISLVTAVSQAADGYDLIFANHHLPGLSEFIEALPMP